MMRRTSARTDVPVLFGDIDMASVQALTLRQSAFNLKFVFT